MWSWIKKTWHWIAIALGGVVGFIVGRRSFGTESDFRELRDDNARLVARLNRLEAELQQSRELNKLSAEQAVDIGNDLATARREVAESGRVLDSGVANVDKLTENNKRLREWISKYEEKIKDL